MALNDVLLHVDTYPEATPDAMIDAAVRLTARLGGKISAMAVEIDFPAKSNRVADYLIGLSDLARDETARCRQNAEERLARFGETARAAGILQDILRERALLFEVSDRVTARARTRDLCIVPLAERFDGQQEVAQAVVFGSGRPVLALGPGSDASGGTGLVALAWDGSRAAARAMADAMPILEQAKAVHVLTALNDKPATRAGQGQDVVRHLKFHGVAAEVREVDGQGEPIGVVLDRHVREAGAEMLVMGAYGHSRLREFILGGATEHMLRAPPVPVFLSH